MSQRFHRPCPGVSSTTGKACESDAECKFCAAVRRAREVELFDPLPELCSPLTPGVQLVNLSHSGDGQILRVDLGDDWMRMFEQLPLVGDGLVMTRNEAAILARRMEFPVLAFTTHGTKGASGDGGLWLAFRGLSSARAVHLRCQSGHIFGVEFADAMGYIIHRFTATPASDLDAFLGWVRLHQACSGHRRARFDIEPVDTQVANRAVNEESGVGSIVPVLDACRELKLTVRTTVHTKGVVQRAQLIPQALQAVENWWFASDDLVGLHFRPAQFVRAEIATQLNERGPRLLLYHRTDAHEPALVLESSDQSQAGVWNDLLQAIVE